MSLIFLAFSAERGATTDQPLAATSVFAGVLATRLPIGQIIPRVVLITVMLIAPVLFVHPVSTTLGSERLPQRFIGLSFLGHDALPRGIFLEHT
ncbi:hypothetical protein N9B39_01455 [bacterium]|nr:hypothetical protein [bacterium]